MTEQMMMFRDITTMRQNINRELDDLASQIVYGNEPTFKYSKDYILSEIEAVFGVYEAKNGSKNGKN